MNNLFKLGYILDGLGSAQEIHKNKEIKEFPEGQLTWMHLNAEETQIREWLLSSAKLPESIIEEFLSDETRPQFRYYEAGILVTLRGINFQPGPQSGDMVSLHIWIEQDRIITISQEDILAITDIVESFEVKKGPVDGADFIVQLMVNINKRISSVVSEIEDEVDDVEDKILDDDTKDIRKSLSQVRRKILVLRRYILPQRDMFLRILTENALGKKHKVQIRDAGERMVRCIEDLDVARDRAMLIQEEITNSISEKMNKTMYMMTMVATIFLPLTFLTGLLGINVNGIPGNENPLAFLIVCGVTILIAIGEYIFFKGKRLL